MTLQYKTWHCNGILLRRFEVSFWYHSWQVCTYFCVCKCLLLQFFCLKDCLLCMDTHTHTHTLSPLYTYTHIALLVINSMALCQPMHELHGLPPIIVDCGYNRNGALRHIVFKIEYILCPSCVCEI